MPVMRLPALLILFLLAVQGCLSAASGEFPMRDRVYCDPEAGISFRYPYGYRQPDQYLGEFRRSDDDQPPAADERVVAGPDGKPVRLRRLGPDGKPRPDVRVFSWALAQPPEGLAADSALPAIGDREAGSALTWKPYDYYREAPDRPFAGRAWAPVDVEASIGAGEGVCVLVVRSGERVGGLVLRGGPDAPAANRRLIDSFEVLATGEKPRPGAKPPAKGKGPRAMTWAEAQCRKNQVFDAGGGLVKLGKAKPVPWQQAWEIETEHYHITANSSPERLAQRAALHEALYRCYAKLYEPERMPPTKAEVHIFDTCDQFDGAARQWVDPGFQARNGSSLIGGFFRPDWLSLWIYEESGAINPRMPIEEVAAHECSHQFLHLACNGSRHVPTWFNEGLAVYFESGQFKNGEFQVRLPADRIGDLRNAYTERRTTLAPLEQYLGHHGPITASQYGEVFAMVHFWVFGTCEPNYQQCKHKKGCGAARFREYWQALKKGEDGAQAFERIFLQDMIKAKGSRAAALEAWRLALVEYVIKRLK